MEEQLDAGALYVINPHCFLIAVVNPMTLISPAVPCSFNWASVL